MLIVSSSKIIVADHSYSCLMAPCPDTLSKEIMQWSRKNISDEQLWTEEDHGREANHHITVKYGIHTTNISEIKSIIQDLKPFDVKLDKISRFTKDDKYDVVKIDVLGDNLRNLNRLISSKLKCTDTFKQYKPHLTIAYVNKGECSDLIGNKEFENIVWTVDELEFSTPDDEKHKLNLGKEKK